MFLPLGLRSQDRPLYRQFNVAELLVLGRGLNPRGTMGSLADAWTGLGFRSSGAFATSTIVQMNVPIESFLSVKRAVETGHGAQQFGPIRRREV